MTRPSFEPSRGRFLHLVPDDKFIEAALTIFEEAAPGAHDSLLVGPPGPLNHLRSLTPQRLELRAVLAPEFLARLPYYSAVFVHYLTDAARLVIAEAPQATRFVWLGWGADYYHLIHSRDELLLPKTRALVSGLPPIAPTNDTESPWRRAVGLAKAVVQPRAAARRYRQRRRARYIGPNAAGETALINRVQAMATPIREDFSALCVNHPELRVTFLDWNYWADGFFADTTPVTPAANNILLGNSATEANNHIDVLETLRDVLPPGRRVFCPLSYGDNRYGDAVEEAGRKLLGERFVPLRSYVDSGTYSQIVGSCSVVVMNHLRQQALGNIIMGMCAGARVFLNERNPIGSAMQRLGVRVYSIDELAAYVRDGEPPLSRQELAEVRTRIEGQYGRASILRRTRTLLGELRAADFGVFGGDLAKLSRGR